MQSINVKLRQTAQLRDWGFIDNSNISDMHLGRDGVHLNKAGLTVFAGNISRQINANLKKEEQRLHTSARQKQTISGRDEEDLQTFATFRQGQRRERMGPYREENFVNGRSYAEVATGKQPGFNMVVSRARLKNRPSIDQREWQVYLGYVRRVTS